MKNALQDMQRFYDAMFKNTIGYDYLTKFVERAGKSFPPYSVIKKNDNGNFWEVQVALAGYGPKDIKVTQTDFQLKVESVKRDDNDADKDEYQYCGIAKRAFAMSLAICQNVNVLSADFKDGILYVTLEKVSPDSEPKEIPVNSDNE